MVALAIEFFLRYFFIYIVNKEQLSAILGISTRSLGAWLSSGIPFISKPSKGEGKEWQFDTAAVIKWHINRKVTKLEQHAQKIPKSIEEARLRQLIAKGTMAELELGRLQKQLIPIADVEQSFSTILSTFKNQMLSIPSKLSPWLQDDVRAILEQEIYDVLTELSSFEL